MKSYREVFPKKNTLLIVIHVKTLEQALRNVVIAEKSGADGVFLINHSFPSEELIKIYQEVRKKYPDWWIGLNFLDLKPWEALACIPMNASGLWVDDAQINEAAKHPTWRAEENWNQRKRMSNWHGLYFGGIAFKYQKTPVHDLGLVCAWATLYMDVITTSGKATGVAADLKKIKTMREAIDENTHDSPLAVASGITPENVKNYVDFVDCFLVSTGVSHSFTELDENRVKELVNEIKK